MLSRMVHALVSYIKMNKAKKDLLEEKPLLRQEVELQEIKTNDDGLLKIYQQMRVDINKLYQLKQKECDAAYHQEQRQLWFDNHRRTRPFYDIESKGDFVEYREYEQAVAVLLTLDEAYRCHQSQVAASYLQRKEETSRGYYARLAVAERAYIRTVAEKMDDAVPPLDEREEDDVVLRMRRN